jgi:hypothetical protein
MTTAVIATESFGGYGTVGNTTQRQGALEWTENQSSALVAGAFSNTKGLDVSGGENYFVGNFASNYSEITVVCRLDISSAATSPFVIILYDNTAVAAQCSILFNSTTGSFSFWRGEPAGIGSGTLLGTSGTNLFTINQTFDFEADIVINGSTGSITARINEVTQLTLTGQNTQATANAYTNGVIFLSNFVGTIVYDISFLTTGLIGVPTSPYLVPTADGTENDFTPSSGANWQNVDSTASQATNYNSSATAGNIDNFQVTTLTGNAPIAVQVKVFAARDNTAGSSIALYVELGGVVALSPTFALTLTPTLYTYVFNLDPNGDAWTTANFNLARWGYKRIA